MVATHSCHLAVTVGGPPRRHRRWTSLPFLMHEHRRHSGRILHLRTPSSSDAHYLVVSVLALVASIALGGPTLDASPPPLLASATARVVSVSPECTPNGPIRRLGSSTIRGYDSYRCDRWGRCHVVVVVEYPAKKSS